MGRKKNRGFSLSSRSLAAGLVAGAALILLLLTVVPGPVVGESADYLAGFARLDPFPPMSHFLWGYVVALLRHLPVKSLAWSGNVFSAVCGAGVVVLVFLLTSRIPHDRNREEVEATFNHNAVGLLSGLFGAGLCLTSIPFWQVATRAHPATFDLLILLGLLWMLVRIGGTEDARGRLYVWAALYGMGMTEYATMIMVAPLVGMAVIWIMWKRRWLTVKRLMVVIGCGAAPLLLYAVYAWDYTQTDAFHWRGFHTFFDSLWFVWRDQYRAIAKSVPRVGWLLLFVVTVVPAVAIFYPKSQSKEGRIAYSIFMHLVMTGVLLVLFLETKLSPWRLLGWRPLLVAPYVLGAAWGGYLAGYWWVVLAHPASWKFRRLVPLEKVVHRLYPLLLAAGAVCLGCKNFPEAVNITDRAVADMARDIVRRLDGRSWLLTSGVLDNPVRLVAAEQHVPLTVVSLPATASEAYLEYVSAQFTNDRLRVLARIGIEPLLEEWLKLEPDAARKIASATDPDILAAVGIRAVPACSLYRGTSPQESVDADVLLGDHRDFWQEVLPRVGTPRAQAERRLGWLRRVLSKEANNFGVFLEDTGRPEEAAEAYRTARLFDTNNISALLNLYALTSRITLPDAQEVQQEFEAFVRDLPRRLRIWSLSYHYGYVRNPQAFVDRGMGWALSGKPRMAISDLERAIRLGAAPSAIQLALGQLYFQRKMLPASREAYLKVLKEDPDNMGALLGLARIAMREGDFNTARGYLERLEKMGLPPAVLLLEKVALESLLGNRAESRRLLERLTEIQPQNAKAWAALAMIAQSEGDDALVEKCLHKLGDLHAAQYPSVRLAIGQIAAAEGKLDAARRHYEEVLRWRPGDMQALELLLQLDIRQRLRSAAEKHALELLRSDPMNYLGNMVLGGQHYLRGEYALAEVCFRTAVKARRTDWALNELAWTLHRLGRNREAVVLAEEALRINPQNVMAWDTLGSVLTALGRLEEADEALQKCIEMRPGDVVVLLHIAKLRAAQGQNEEALKLVESLLLRGAELPPELYEEARDLARRLRAGGRAA